MIVRPHGIGNRLMDPTTLSRFLRVPRTTIIKACTPTACDVTSRRTLYDARHSNTELETFYRTHKRRHAHRDAAA